MAGRFYYPECRAILQVVFDGFGDSAHDTDPVPIPVLPKRATVHRNSYRLADSWELEFDANDLPIHPRQVRAGVAEIYMYQKQGTQGSQRVVSRQFATTDDTSAQKARSTIAALQREFGTKESRDKFVFDHEPMVVGLFDQHSLRMAEDGKTVTITGQDYTAFLAAKQWPPTSRGTVRRIPTGRPLGETLRNILEEADVDGRLTLALEGVHESELPIVGRRDTEANRGRGIPVDASTSYWDVMYKLAERHGFILFVRGLKVVLSKPKNIDSVFHDVKHMAWGVNLKALDMDRRLGKQKTPRIIVRSYNADDREVLEAQFPTAGIGGKQIVLKGKVRTTQRTTERFRAQAAKPTTKPKIQTLKREDEYQIIPMFGVSDMVTLQLAAERLYYLLGNSETKLVAVTKDLSDMDGADILSMSAGDALMVHWQDFNAETFSAMDEDERYQHMISRGYNSEIARVIAQNYVVLLQQDRPMRFREGSFDWSVDDGITIEMELIDFIVLDGLRGGDQVDPTQKRLDRVRTVAGVRIGNPLIDGAA